MQAYFRSLLSDAVEESLYVAGAQPVMGFVLRRPASAGFDKVDDTVAAGIYRFL
jgi:hypothetical protein